VQKYLTFLAVGSLFATVEEFLTVVVLRRDIASFVFTLVVLFPVILTLVHLSSRLPGRLLRSVPAVVYIVSLLTSATFVSLWSFRSSCLATLCCISSTLGTRGSPFRRQGSGDLISFRVGPNVS
jgi:hypothetical protein